MLLAKHAHSGFSRARYGRAVQASQSRLMAMNANARMLTHVHVHMSVIGFGRRFVADQDVRQTEGAQD